MAFVFVLLAASLVALCALLRRVSQRPRVQRARWITATTVAAVLAGSRGLSNASEVTPASREGLAPAAKKPRRGKKRGKKRRKRGAESDRVLLVTDQDAAGGEQEDDEDNEVDDEGEEESAADVDVELAQPWRDEVDRPSAAPAVAREVVRKEPLAEARRQHDLD